MWVDVNLPEKVKAVQFKFQQRNGNGQVRNYTIGGSADGSDMQVIGKGSTTANGGEEDATDPYYTPEGTNKVRFGVTYSSMGDLTGTQGGGPAKSMALAELEVWVLK